MIFRKNICVNMRIAKMYELIQDTSVDQNLYSHVNLEIGKIKTFPGTFSFHCNFFGIAFSRHTILLE